MNKLKIKLTIFIASIIASPLLLNASNGGEISAVKVHDGSQTQCETKADYLLSIGRQGAYQVTASNLSFDEEFVEFDMTLEFLACLPNQTGYAFKPMSPYEKYSYSYPGTDESEKTINISPVPEKAFLRGASDYRAGDLLIETAMADKATQSLHVRLKWDDLIVPADPEQQRGYDLGALDINVTRAVDISFDQETESYREIFMYGLYRILIKKNK